MIDMEHLIRLRRDLHRHPELSGAEKETAQRIRSFVARFDPDRIVDNIGGDGLAFIFNGKEDGPAVLLRCELDALPIREVNDFDHKSEMDGVAHLCGHDGHMAIMAGVAEAISLKRPLTGSVILLYQPAEETGQGGSLVVNDPMFKELNPDWVFALHNIPGYPGGSVLLREGPFASASVGIEVKLYGKTSHAGEPEKGINPARAVAEIMNGIMDLPDQKHLFGEMVLATIVHVSLGSIAFGTSAGYAEVRATLRAYLDKDLERLQVMAEDMAADSARRAQLRHTVGFVEYFPAVNNNAEANGIIREAAMKNELSLIELEAPFRWSEDFSHIINVSKGALFGLGAGTDTPKLHNPDYDFPDEIIQPGIRMFSSIIYKILGSQ
jgi:amidohydrolase